jgi:hypothetical protein
LDCYICLQMIFIPSGIPKFKLLHYRIFFIPVLFAFCILALSQAFATPNDSIVIQSCVHNEDGQITSSTEVDTFDVGTGLLRVHVAGTFVTTYVYNALNLVDTVSVFHSTQPSSRVSHQYNTINKDSIVLGESYVSNAWVDDNRFLYDYDTLGRLLTKTQEDWNISWVNYSTTNYFYSTTLDSIVNVYSSGSMQKEVYTYDSVGNYSVSHYNWNADSVYWILNDQVGESYNANGQLLSCHSYDYYCSYMYDSLGRLIYFSGASAFQGGAFSYTAYQYGCSGLLEHTESSYSTSQQGRSTTCNYYYVGTSEIYVSLEPNHVTCKGAVIHFDDSLIFGTPPVSYLWTPAAGLSSDTVLSPDASPDSTTIYTLTATDSLGNIFTGCVTIVVKPVPSVTLTALDSINICYGDTVHLLASSPDSITSYKFYRDGFLQQSGLNTVYGAIVTASYYVIAIGTNNCGARSDTIDVYANFASLVYLHASHNQNCIGDSSTMYITPANNPYLNYQWIFNGTNISGATDSTLQVDTTGFYTVEISSDTSTCVYTPSNYYVSFSLKPTPNIFPDDTTICRGKTINLGTAKVQGYQYFISANGVYTQWYGNNDTTTYIPQSPSYYRIKAVNNGCAGYSDSTFVDWYPLISYSLIADPAPPYCSGDTVQISTSIPSANGYYHWTTGSNDSSISITASAVIGVYINDSNNCQVFQRDTFDIFPVPGFPTITQNGQVLTAHSGVVTYQWLYEDSLIPGATQQNYTATQAGFYTVEVSNSFGCTVLSLPFWYSPVGIIYPSENDYAFITGSQSGEINTLHVSESIIHSNCILEIYDLPGQIIIHTSLKQQATDFFKSDFTTGIYLWKILNSDSRNILYAGKMFFR